MPGLDPGIYRKRSGRAKARPIFLANDVGSVELSENDYGESRCETHDPNASDLALSTDLELRYRYGGKLMAF